MAGTGQGQQRQPLRKGLQESWTPFIHSSLVGTGQLSLGLLLKEVAVFLLLQLAVVPLDLPISLFHVIIHELVHDWHLVKEVRREPGGQEGQRTYPRGPVCR